MDGKFVVNLSRSEIDRALIEYSLLKLGIESEFFVTRGTVDFQLAAGEFTPNLVESVRIGFDLTEIESDNADSDS